MSHFKPRAGDAGTSCAIDPLRWIKRGHWVEGARLNDSEPKTLPFSIVGRLQSVGHAVAGVAYMVRTQHSAWFHLAVTAALTGLAVWARLSAGDWRWIVVAIFFVWVAEALNTAIEVLCDLVSPGYSVAIKRVKDVGAGAVLLSACCAAGISVLTLWPYLVK